MMKFTVETLLGQLYKLILDVQLSSVERSILTTGKQGLEQGVYFPKVVQDLKLALAPLAIQQQLSPPVVNLLASLTRQYPGDNMWDQFVR